MNRFFARRRALVLAMFATLCGGAACRSAEAAGPQPIALGTFQVIVPEGWTKKTPRSSIISYEFTVPAAKGDENEGRMTVMAAGGGVEANIERWFTQFKQPDGSATKDKAKVEEKTIADQKVHLVDISGTYKDSPSPRAPGVDREKYRMLAAIITTDEASFFLKFYGPEATIEAHRDEFLKMVEGLSAR